MLFPHAVFTASGFIRLYKPSVCIRRGVYFEFSFCLGFYSCVQLFVGRHRSLFSCFSFTLSYGHAFFSSMLSHTLSEYCLACRFFSFLYRVRGFLLVRDCELFYEPQSLFYNLEASFLQTLQELAASASRAALLASALLALHRLLLLTHSFLLTQDSIA